MLVLKKFYERCIILMSTLALLVGFTSACVDDKSDDNPVSVIQAPDTDGDGVPDNPDNCPGVSNPLQENNDGDEEDFDEQQGDACDDDDDNDGVLDVNDNCQFVWNDDQLNTDWADSNVTGDAYGDACDDDDDNDGVCDVGVADVLLQSVCTGQDNCQWTYNPLQENLDQDFWGDACDNDWDWDGVVNILDNCPVTQNQFQDDSDGDCRDYGTFDGNQTCGDACDPDDDNDGACDPGPADDLSLPRAPSMMVVCTETDNCPDLANPDQADDDNDTLGNWCDDDCDNDGFIEAYYPEDFPNLYCDGDDNCTLNEQCNDGNPCTDDSCNGNTCVHVNNTSPCDDGAYCTVTDTCNNNGECVGTGNPCLGADGDGDCAESCDEGANDCHGWDPNTSLCDDDSNCTATDMCSDGQCVGTPMVCTDGNACTGLETCVSGVCTNPTDLDCDDGNPCTTDSCDEVTGCVHVNNTSPCNDNAWCNGADTCGGGSCSVHAGNPCAGQDTGNNCADSCNEDGDACNANDSSHSCNDGNACTIGEMCSAGQCTDGVVDPNCGIVDLHGRTPPNTGGGNGGPNPDGTDDQRDDDGDCYCETLPCSAGSVNSTCGTLLGGDCDDDPDDQTTTIRNPGANQFSSDGSYYNNPGPDAHEADGDEWWNDDFDNDCDNTVDDGFPG